MNQNAPNIHPREVRQALMWFAGVLWRGAPWAMAVGVCGQFLPALLPAARILVIKELVDGVHAVYGQGEAGFATVVPLLAWLAGLRLLEAMLSAVRGHAAAVVREKTSWKLQERVLEQAAQVGLDKFEYPEFFDRMQRALRAAYFRAYGIFRDAMSTLESAIVICTLIALFAIGHWSIPVVLFLGTAPIFYTQMRRGREIYALFYEQTPEQRRAEYLVGLMTDRDAAKEIRLYGLGDFLCRTWESLAQTLRQQRFRLTLQQQRYLFGGRLSGIGSALLALVILLYQAAYGALTLGGFFALAEAIVRFQGTLFQMLRQMGDVFEQALYIRDLRSFVESPTEQGAGWEELSEQPLDIAVEGLGFAYGDGPPVLNGVELRLRPGEKLALVGANGAGKTTLVKLLLGLYPPGEGRVLYNGVDGRRIDPEVLRRRCAAVFQDFVQYQRTARENIGYGQAEELGDQARVERAAQEGGSAPLVEALAARYDATLGRYFEGGQDLSRGQWQKLALSRAYFRDAQLLVFDEPTAALDPRAELEVFRQFRALSEGKSAVFVSHRMASARVADRILVLDGGRVLEEGTHDELMARGGEYARMFALQAQGYQ